MTFDAKGKGLTPELFYAMFERIEIPFDEQGKPIMPTLVFNPAQIEKVKEILSRPEVQVRIDAIIMRKWFEKYST